METIAKIRRAYFVQKKAIKEICRELKVSRKMVRKVLRSGATEFVYERKVQPQPKIGPWREELDRLLAVNAARASRERLTLIRMFEELRGLGYEGGYDAVRRYAAAWQRERAAATAAAFVPLSFAPGEAYQFDWSHEVVLIAGVTVTVKVAQVRLCHSRMLFVRAYPRESQEMVFDAHDRAFAFFRGACTRGHLRQHEDGGGRDPRRQGPRLQPALPADVRALPGRAGGVHAGVGLGEGPGREPGRHGAAAVLLAAGAGEELRGAERLAASTAASPGRRRSRIRSVRDRTIWQMFEAERPSLVPYAGPFDGFHATPVSPSKTCLVRFDNNKYSVMASAVGRPVEVRAYADRIELRQDGRIVGQHRRAFGRGQTVYDPWHYVPVLARKPGALRNGAPFQDWVLPAALERVRRKLKAAPDGDRQMVEVLGAVLTDGLPAVEAACAEALKEGVHSADVILNILSRRRDPGPPATIMTPEALRLRHEPAADCARYDSLRRASG